MFFHGDAVEDVRHADGAFVVSDDDELGMIEETLQDFDKAVDVRFIERSIQFVQNTEWAGLDLVNREEQGDCGHGLFAAGKQRDALKLFSWGASDDFDTAFENVTFVSENQIRFAATENFDERFLEIVANFGERFREHFLRLRVDLIQSFEEL